MAKYITKRLFKPKKGIDLKSSEILRGENYLTYSQNTVWDNQSNQAKRPGTHLRIYGVPAFSGMVRFDSTNFKGVSKSELIFVGGDNPVRVLKRYFTITNNTALSISVSMLFEPVTSVYRMVITGGATADISLGTGLLGGDMTLAGLVLSLPPNVVGSSTNGIMTVKAAFLETKTMVIAAGAAGTLEYFSTEDIQYGNAFSSVVNSTSEPRKNPTTAILGSSIYWYPEQTGTSGYLYKYDGLNWYRAGCEKVQAVRTGLVASGGAASRLDVKGYHSYSQATAWVDRSYDIWARGVFVDNAGAYHYGDFVPLKLTNYSNAEAVGFQKIKCYLGDPYAFNSRSSIANGVQNNVLTINVFSNEAGTNRPVHHIRAGDIAYFWDNLSGSFVQREVMSVGATSITISNLNLDGTVAGNVSVNDYCVISNNSRYQIFVQTSNSVDPNSFYQMLTGNLIAEVPMLEAYVSITGGPLSVLYDADIFWSTEAIAKVDYKPDAVTYTFDGATAYPAPTGKYVASTANGSSLLVSGNIQSDNTVYCSRVEDSEQFYLGRNAFTVEEKITALGTSGSVSIVATANKSYAVSGDIPALNFRVEKITENLGVYSASSVTEVDEGAIYFVSHRGPMLLLGGRQLTPVGPWDQDKNVCVIEPYFTHIYDTAVPNPVFSVTSSYVIKERKWIITNVPWYFGTAFSSSTSGTWMFDYGIGGWTTWSGVDSSCGAAYWDDKVWLAGQGAGGTINLVSMTENNGVYNYSDHGAPILAMIRYHWENGGDINLYKKFLWLTLHTPCGYSLPYNVDVKTYANYEIVKANAFSIPTAQHTSFSKYALPPAYTVEAKLRTGKMASLMLEVSNGVVNEGLWVGGTEMDIAGDFQTPSRPGRSDS
jgi:hypothetical protein